MTHNTRRSGPQTSGRWAAASIILVAGLLILSSTLMVGHVEGFPVAGPVQAIGGPARAGESPANGILAPHRPALAPGPIPVGNYPDAIAFDPVVDHLFVASGSANDVSVINASTNQLLTDVNVGGLPDALAIDYLNNTLFVADEDSSAVSVVNISTDTVVATDVVGNCPIALVWDNATDDVFVANYCSSVSAITVTVISGTSDADLGNITIAPVGLEGPFYGPVALAFDWINGDVYLANAADIAYMSVISGTSFSVLTTIPTGQANAIAFDPASNRVYLAVYSPASSLCVVNATTNSIVTNVTVGSDPYDVAVNAETGLVYVANHGSGNVSVVSTANDSLITSVGTGNGPSYLSVDPALHGVIVSNEQSDTVSLVSDATLTAVESFPTGAEPWWQVYDPVSGEAYVVNYAGASVTVLGAYGMTFLESGLPSGTLWQVTLNSTTVTSLNHSLSFYGLFNGTYSFAVGDVPGYTANQTSGLASVHGGTAEVDLRFAPANPELGLLFTIYAQRPDLEAAFPGAGSGNVSSLSGLVSWAAEVAEGQFPDAAFNLLAGPVFGPYYVLMGVYNSRSDLQTAFPNAYSNEGSFEGLLWWAGQVVTGQFTDPANATLGPWGYLYDLDAVYLSRADLQSAFPNAIENSSSAGELIDWAGGVVTGAYPDASYTALQPYGYWYALIDLYDGRSDLQVAYPFAYGSVSNYTLLVNWAGGVVTHEFTDADNATLNPFGYYYDLMMVYDGRSDLQAAYPNAFTNSTSYATLLAWAKDVVEKVFTDTAYTELEYYATYYETYG